MKVQIPNRSPEIDLQTQNLKCTLQLTNVSYRDVLRQITTSWTEGELVGLIGPNGAGKSTLMRLLAGIIQASEGEIRLNGKPISSMTPETRAIDMAYLPQQIPDDVSYTVSEFVEMGRYIYRTKWGGITIESKRRVHEALQQLNLEKYEQISLMDLSGGERQRAAIARCLAQGSRVILLDEPIASLDLFYRLEIMDHLDKLAKAGYLIVLVVHDLEIAARYCSNLLLLKNGQVYKQGTPAEVLTEEAFQEVFGVKMKAFPDPNGGYLRFSYSL